MEKYFDHPAVQHHCAMEFERIRFYTMQIEALEQIILNSVKDDPSYELLKTIPGVGRILAAIILYESGDISRFKSHKHYCSYA